jgi:hypothetical protein
VPHSNLRYPIQLQRDDFTPLSLEDLAVRMRVSRSFLRLCAEVGCPTDGTKMNAAAVLIWLFDNYPDVRAAAGLVPLAPIDALPAEVSDRLRLANALCTLLEYSRSRATHWQQKRHLRQALEQALRLVDGAA